MSFRTDHITLDLQRSSREPVSKLRYRQHDKGATVEIAIVNGGSTVDLAGHTVHFMCETRGGLVETVLPVSGSTCTYTLDPATTAYQGIVKPYLEIRNGDTVIASTSLFEIQLDGAADIAGPQAEATSSTLDALTDQTNNLAQQTAAALASANAATTAANTAATKADTSASASATQTAACKAATDAAVDVATTALSKRRADTLYANALIGHAQGDMVHVEDAWEADAVGLRVMGKSAQTVTVGKNLFDAAASGVTQGYVDNTGVIQSNAAWIVSDYIKVTAGQYKLSGLTTHPNTGTDNFIIYDLNKVKIGNKSVGASASLDIAFECIVRFSCKRDEANKVQLETGATATAYEPYTGGQPSPSPSYPQVINGVTSPIKLVRTGKNLLDTRSFVTANASNVVFNETTGYLKFDYNGDYASVIFNMPIVEGSFKFAIKNQSNTSSATTMPTCDVVGVDDKVRYLTADNITVYATDKQVRVRVFGNNSPTPQSGTATCTLENLVQRSSNYGAYEPYKGNTYGITLPSDHNYLASLPDGTRDDLVLRSDGVAVLTELVQKVVFNGTENWVIWKTSGTFTWFDHKINTATEIGINNSPGMCQKYRVVPQNIGSDSLENNLKRGVQCLSIAGGDGSYISIVDGYTSVDQLKASLVANPATVYYRLKVPITLYSADNGATWSTTDPAAGQSAIPLNKGTNNVWCTDPLSPEVSLDYVQDTNAIINELRAAIVASGATS